MLLFCWIIGYFIVCAIGLVAVGSVVQWRTKILEEERHDDALRRQHDSWSSVVRCTCETAPRCASNHAAPTDTHVPAPVATT